MLMTVLCALEVMSNTKKEARVESVTKAKTTVHCLGRRPQAAGFNKATTEVKTVTRPRSAGGFI